MGVQGAFDHGLRSRCSPCQDAEGCRMVMARKLLSGRRCCFVVRRLPRSRGTAVPPSRSIRPVAGATPVLGRSGCGSWSSPRPSVARFSSCPRCSVVSSLGAVSRTFPGELLEQPARPGQGQALLHRQPKQLPGPRSSAEGSCFPVASCRSVSSLSRVLPCRHTSAGRAGNALGSTVLGRLNRPHIAGAQSIGAGSTITVPGRWP
jgi:hypothetical protein